MLIVSKKKKFVILRWTVGAEAMYVVEAYGSVWSGERTRLKRCDSKRIVWPRPNIIRLI